MMAASIGSKSTSVRSGSRWPACAGTGRSCRAGETSSPMSSRGGGRLLAAGNGGSAAEAQHLTAELVGRFLERTPRPVGDLPQCRDIESDSHCQRLRRRGDVRPAGRGARSAGRRTGAAVDVRAQPERAARGRTRPGGGHRHLGDHRSGAEPAERPVRRRRPGARAVHRCHPGGPSRSPCTDCARWSMRPSWIGGIAGCWTRRSATALPSRPVRANCATDVRTCIRRWIRS